MEANEIRQIEISALGRYYMNKLVYYFEYLTFMKDDVDLPYTGLGIKDCIEEPTPKGKYYELHKFFDFFYEEEVEFLMPLNIEQRKNLPKTLCAFQQNALFLHQDPGIDAKFWASAGGAAQNMCRPTSNCWAPSKAPITGFYTIWAMNEEDSDLLCAGSDRPGPCAAVLGLESDNGLGEIQRGVV